ncbi:MAG: BatA domain-containing protein [Verrucomicrobiales bacterium]|nr:BatA domain-containing protein [Verrucomicrobiales bacterium]
MNFLAPLFLAGAAAVALPILFHLVRRTTRERMPFSSLLFLTQTPPRVTRRNRIEDLLLLALRCLALVLLAAGFARPFLRDSTLVDLSDKPPERVLHLVDVSASMRRAGLWEAARERVETRVREASPADEVSVWVFDVQARPLVTFAEWGATPAGSRAALVAGRLRETQPGWMGTHLDDALATGAEALAEGSTGSGAGAPARRGRQRVVVVTDLQEGARLERLPAFDWPKGMELAVETVKPRHAGNAGLQWVAEMSESASATQAVVRVRVVNSSDATQGRFEVGWRAPTGEGFLGRAEEVLVPPGQSRVVPLPVPAGAAVDRVMLRGDEESFDNEVHVVPPVFSAVDVLYLGSDAVTEDPQQALFFLRKALPVAGRLSVRLTAAPARAALDPARLAAAKLVVVTDSLPEATARALRAEVERGKTVVFAPGTAEAYGGLGTLLGVAEVPVREAGLRRYAMLASVDTRHPVLAVFADPRFGDFTKIHFWKHRRVDLSAVPGARVMASFDSGDVAWAEVAAGQGRVLILASGWEPAESQFGLSTKFVPFFCAVLEYAGGAVEGAKPWTVGDSLPLPEVGTGVRTVRLPSGERSEVAAGVTRFAATLAPGIYTVEAGGPALRHAVNVEGAESRTAPGALESLESLGAPVRVQEAESKPDPVAREQLAAVETESRQKLWRWLIAATLGVLLVESAIAAWSSRRMQYEREVVP